MTIGDALQTTVCARNDAEQLLAGLLDVRTSWLFAHPDNVLPPAVVQSWHEGVRRLSDGEPLAYVRGCEVFFGRQFFVDARVLIPRPSTEELIRTVIALYHSAGKPPLCTATQIDEGIACLAWLRRAPPPCIIDACAGSGCIGISLALELPQVQVLCTDSSRDAIDVARTNAERLAPGRVRVAVESNLPARLVDGPYLLVANPPYIPQKEHVQESVRRWEPAEALWAGMDGMDVLRPLLAACVGDPRCAGAVLECRSDQVQTLCELLP